MENQLILLINLFEYSYKIYFIFPLIAIPIFIFWRWVYTKFIFRNTYRIVAIWVSTLIIIPIIYYGLVTLFFYILFKEPRCDFEKSKWLNNKEKRYEMADDIVNSNMLVGVDTNKIIQCLGKPDSRDSTNTTWFYDMGTGSAGFSLSIHELSIKIQENKVVKVEDIQDIFD